MRTFRFTTVWKIQQVSNEWERFGTELQKQLASLEVPREFARGEMAVFQSARLALEGAVLATIEAVVPKMKPTPFDKRWWSKDLA